MDADDKNFSFFSAFTELYKSERYFEGRELNLIRTEVQEWYANEIVKRNILDWVENRDICWEIPQHKYTEWANRTSAMRLSPVRHTPTPVLMYTHTLHPPACYLKNYEKLLECIQ